MNRATAAGKPEKKTVQPPSTAAHASKPLTALVASVESFSQKTWSVATVDIPRSYAAGETQLVTGARKVAP